MRDMGGAPNRGMSSAPVLNAPPGTTPVPVPFGLTGLGTPVRGPMLSGTPALANSAFALAGQGGASPAAGMGPGSACVSPCSTPGYAGGPARAPFMSHMARHPSVHPHSGSASIPNGKQFVNVQRSPSRVRQTPGGMRVEYVASPMPMRGAHTPGVNVNMPRSCSSSSSHASFYYNQQHPVGVPPGTCAAASMYMADPADPIDLMVAAGLATLDRASASKLMLRRLNMGKYEIDGRKVSVRWGDLGGISGLVACEDEVKDQSSGEMPLIAYLSQAANVAAALLGGRSDMPKISRIPKEQRLTFADDSSQDATQALKLDDIGNERCESMRIACEQAMLREQAAEAYERSLQNPFARSRPVQPRNRH